MSIPEKKFCPSCEILKNSEEFHQRTDKGYTYLKSYCKICCSKKSRHSWYDKCSCGNRKTKRSDKCQSCTRSPLHQLQSRDAVRKRIMVDKLLPYECQECGNIGEYNGQHLVLHLDHIDGNRDNHTLSNLRFLCPNCHSQTNTYCGRNIGSSRSKS